jgi:hypothetical protein
MIKTPLVPLKPNHKTQFLFLFLFGLNYFFLICVLFPSNSYLLFVLADDFYIYPLVTILLGIIVVIAMLFATIRNPGVIKPDTSTFTYLDLLQKVLPSLTSRSTPPICVLTAKSSALQDLVTAPSAIAVSNALIIIAPGSIIA